MTDDPEKNTVQGEAIPAKRRRGRPPTILPDTFEETMRALAPRYQQFVRHVLAGLSYAESYRRSSPTPISDGTALTAGQKLAKLHLVNHALALGKEQGAVQAISELKYDVVAAMAELLDAMAFAKQTENASALAKLIELRAKLFRLVDQNAPQLAQQVTFLFKRYGETEPAITIEKEDHEPTD